MTRPSAVELVSSEWRSAVTFCSRPTSFQRRARMRGGARTTLPGCTRSRALSNAAGCGICLSPLIGPLTIRTISEGASLVARHPPPDPPPRVAQQRHALLLWFSKETRLTLRWIAHSQHGGCTTLLRPHHTDPTPRTAAVIHAADAMNTRFSQRRGKPRDTTLQTANP